ncbi:MAG TPA: Ig-like domain-containing protein, partial [Gallionella sp.]
MKNLFFYQTIFRFPLYFFLSVAVILTGCGAGKRDTPVSTVPGLVITLTNSSGVPVSSITSGTPATVKATLKDATGTAVVGAVVTFSTDTTLATISPAATALTDSTGVATVTLNSA